MSLFDAITIRKRFLTLVLYAWCIYTGILGLFHKIILQSGNALNIWSEGDRNSARELAKILGLVSENDKEILEFLQQQPVDLLFKAQEKVKAVRTI